MLDIASELGLKGGESMFETQNSVLRKMPVLAGLSDKTLDQILEDAKPLELQQGEYFFHEGDDAETLFVILHGTVIVERRWNESEVVLGTLGEGDCFGEMSVIDLMPRSASVRAETACKALEVPHLSLRQLYQRDLEQYAIIMMNMGREVSRRLRVTDDRLFALERKLPALTT